MRQADEMLEAASANYNIGQYKTSLNRSYYAVFHSMRAVNVHQPITSVRNPIMTISLSPARVMPNHSSVTLKPLSKPCMDIWTVLPHSRLIERADELHSLGYIKENVEKMA
jgi:hypothetical protein